MKSAFAFAIQVKPAYFPIFKNLDLIKKTEQLMLKEIR